MSGWISAVGSAEEKWGEIKQKASERILKSRELSFCFMSCWLMPFLSLRLILTQWKMKNVPWSSVTFILLSVNVVTGLYELYIIPKEFTRRIPEEDRNGPDASQPSMGTSFHDDAIPVIERVHPLRGLMNSLGSHNQLLCSRDLKERKIKAKNPPAFNPCGGEVSWKVINETVWEHKSLICFWLRILLTRTPRK